MNGHSSKDLMYIEYTGTSVAEHMLETLEKKSGGNHYEKKNKTYDIRGKSETFKRAKKLASFIDEEQDASPDTENKEGVAVVMDVDENSPQPNINAWFFMDLQKQQESKCSGDETANNSDLLNYSYSSDSSDSESEQNFPIISNKFVFNERVSSTSSSHKKNLKSSKTTNNALHFLNDDSSDASSDELQQNFPVISYGFTLNDRDSSNCSNVESESNLSH